MLMTKADDRSKLFPEGVARPLEALSINAYHVLSQGWKLRVTARYAGQSFAEGYSEDYRGLTTDEMLEVIDSEVSRLDELRGGKR